MKYSAVLMLACSLSFPFSLPAAEPDRIRLSIDLAAPGKAISPDLVGVFFEDLNYAADGGLYAELLQNRSFEYSATEQPGWGPHTGWELVKGGGATGISGSEMRGRCIRTIHTTSSLP